MPVRPSPPIVAGEDENTCRGVFMEFMSKVARFEDLAKSGERLLVRFCQDLEYFRSPQIPNGSDVMNQIVKSNSSGRMWSYLEAGCRLHCQNISNINQLHSCEDGLKDHISKVKTLLEELECLVKDVYAITLTASISALKVSDGHAIDNKLTIETCIIGVDRPVRPAYQPPGSSTFLSEKTNHQQSVSSTFLSEQTSTNRQQPAKRTGRMSLFQHFLLLNHLHSVLFNREYLAVYNDEVRWKPGNMLHLLQEDKSADRLDSDVFLVTVMVIVRNMLKLDYTMQENIVGALSLKTLPSELEGYCLMWDLHPYIDHDVMHLAWEM